MFKKNRLKKIDKEVEEAYKSAIDYQDECHTKIVRLRQQLRAAIESRTEVSNRLLYLSEAMNEESKQVVAEHESKTSAYNGIFRW